VFVRTDGQRWEIEARLDSAEGRSTVRSSPDEASAITVAESRLDGRFTWNELTS
jgi:hypothetical protein